MSRQVVYEHRKKKCEESQGVICYSLQSLQFVIMLHFDTGDTDLTQIG